MFEHERIESQTHTRAEDHYSAVIQDHDVLLTIRDDGVASVDICPNSWDDGLRLPMLRFHPKHVDDLERLADAAPALFREVARELRALGKEDLRSEWDKMGDDLLERLKG